MYCEYAFVDEDEGAVGLDFANNSTRVLVSARVVYLEEIL